MKKRLVETMSILGMIGTTVGWIRNAKKGKTDCAYMNARISKFQKYFDVTNEWIRLKNQGRNLEEFFVKNGWSHIAVYGMGELGNRLAEELKNSSITIEYAIDRKADTVSSQVEVKELGKDLPSVDVIVVTPFFMYNQIEEELLDLVDYPVVSIEDVVYFI